MTLSPLFRFYRKGEVGNWKEYFEEGGDMLKEWNKWIDEKLEGTDIKFVFD